MPATIDPSVTATQLLGLCQNPCGDDCFLLQPLGLPVRHNGVLFGTNCQVDIHLRPPMTGARPT